MPKAISNMNRGPILGIDWGTKRVGVAVSDEEANIAHGRAVYVRKDLESDVSHIKELARESGVKEVVIGLPLDMEGTEGRQAERARGFKEKLQDELDLTVKEVDERLTSSEAERVMLEADLGRKERKETRDKLAAVLILQRYLDRLG